MRILVTGSDGLLGRLFLRRFGEHALGFDLPDLDITLMDQVTTAVEKVNPDWIVNCAALTDIDYCQLRPEDAMAVHFHGVANLAATGRRLLTVSTDHVFNRSSPEPALEGDPTSPANSYAESKLAGENAALEYGDNIVVRTSWLFAGWKGLVPEFWKRLSGEGTVAAITDQTSSLTYAPDLVDAAVTVMRKGESGIFHMANGGALTPFLIAAEISRMLGKGNVRPVKWKDLKVDAPRPVCSVLGTSRDILLPEAWDAIERWRKKYV